METCTEAASELNVFGLEYPPSKAPRLRDKLREVSVVELMQARSITAHSLQL